MKPVRIFLVLCSAVLACNRENPVRPAFGDRPADPAQLLRSLQTAKGAERARMLQRLGLTKDAIAAWDAVVREQSKNSDEARKQRSALMQRRDPMDDWNASSLHSEPQRLAQAYPYESMVALLDNGLTDRPAARIVAETLTTHGDFYLHDVLGALERTSNSATMHAYNDACSSNDPAAYERAAVLLEHDSNPLFLYARYRAAWFRYVTEDVAPLLDALIPITDRRYPILLCAMHTLRAVALEQNSSYFLAQADYDAALRLAGSSPTLHASALSRRGLNFGTVGSAEKGFANAVAALQILPRVADLSTRAHVYAGAAQIASELGFPQTALLYRNEVIDVAQKGLPVQRKVALNVLAVGYRERANTHTLLDDNSAAEVDLSRARDLAEAMEKPERREYLRMRLRDVLAETRLTTNPAEAAQLFREAIQLAGEQHSTYRAVLHFKLAEARRRAGDAGADKDVVTAFEILRDEAKHLLDARKRGEYEELWSLYFARFRERLSGAIERSIQENRVDDAFVLDEQGRAFEPLHAILQSRFRPLDFQPITSRATLDRALNALPEDTVILQYRVLPERTYVWVLERGQEIRVFPLAVTEDQIERWRSEALDVVATGQPDALTRPMRAAYAALFRVPLPEGTPPKHLVIIPDGPMHGLPFAALEGTTEGYLLTRVRSITTDASTTRYLYSRARDAQFRTNGNPSVLLTAATAFDPRSELGPLQHAESEVEQLRRDSYPQARVLSGVEATVPRFLAEARGATILHFAGHAIPVPRRPWESRLLLASGELTAEQLMRELSELEQTRLVVLGGCSTAGDQPIGPEGLAPLVRPLIAANVPAVVGTLWEVNDATAADLLVSLHCHYRHGDAVAEALREAQLERLRVGKPAMSWAPYQVVGYAGSPYPRDPAMEKTHSESVCAQHSLQRTDGLHPE